MRAIDGEVRRVRAESWGEAAFWALVEAYIRRRGFRIVAWRDAYDVRGVRPSVHLVEKLEERVTYVRLFCASPDALPLSEIVRATLRMGDMLRRRFRAPSLETVLLLVACSARAGDARSDLGPFSDGNSVNAALAEVPKAANFLLGILFPAEGEFALFDSEVPRAGSPVSDADARESSAASEGEAPHSQSLAKRESAFWQEVLAGGLRPYLPRYARWWSGSFFSSPLAGSLRRRGGHVPPSPEGGREVRPPMFGTYLLLGTSAAAYLLLSWPELANRLQEVWLRHAGVFGLVLEGLGSPFVFGGFSSLVLAALALYVLAPPAESAFGTARLLTLYVGGGLLGVRWAEALSGAETWGGTAALYALVGGLMSFLLRRRRLLGREFLVDAGVLLGIALLLLFAFASVHPVLALGGLLGGTLLSVALTPELGASPVRTSFWALVAYGLFLAWGMLSA